jgi:molecular chaperone DnaK
MHLIEKAENCIKTALKNANVSQPKGIDRILLVGGTTYIPAVRKLIRKVFGKEGRTDVNPDLAVAMGAAVEAAMIKGQISTEAGLIKTDVSPFGLGIQVAEIVGGQLLLVYKPLINPNTTIPYSVREELSLLHEEQECVRIHLYQDHTGKAKLPSEAIPTGQSGEITDIPPSPTGRPYPLDVDFSYDLNGLVKVVASIPDINRNVEITYHSSDTRMNTVEIAKSTEKIRELWKQNYKSKRYESLLNKAERYMESIPASERAPLSTVVMQLKEALVDDNSSKIEKAGDRLTDMMFDLENY